MKRLTVFILFVGCITILSGCSFGVEYEFLHTTEEITSIEIVKLLEPETENTKFKDEVLSTVDDIDSFIEKFTEINCKTTSLGSPTLMSVYTTAIKITYANGDYEFIDYDAQYMILSDRPGGQLGYYRFDKQEFKELIKQYYPPEELPPSKVSDQVDESNNP